VRYVSKPLEFAKGKNVIELGCEAEVADVLAKVCKAPELCELDALIGQQREFVRLNDTRLETILQAKYGIFPDA